MTTTLTGTRGAPDAAALAGPAADGAGGPGPGRPGRRPAWRRWRAPAAIVAVIIAGGIIVALLQPSAGTTGYLDPGNPSPNGARALANLLAERGTAVIRVPTVATAAAPRHPPVRGRAAGR